MLKKLLIVGFMSMSLFLFSCCQTSNTIKQDSIEIAAGNGFSLIIDSGSLYGFGQTLFGVLGNGSSHVDELLSLTKLNDFFDLSSDEIFVSVYAGENNAFAITSENRLWAWGHNLLGQTGSGSFEQMLLTPVDITDNLNLEKDEFIFKMVVDRNHTMLLTTKGRILGWGSNLEDNLPSHEFDKGIDYDQIVSSPKDFTDFFELDDDENIIDIGAFAALTSSHKVFIWSELSLNNSLMQIDSEIPLNDDEYIKEIISDGRLLKTSQNRFLNIIKKTSFGSNQPLFKLIYSDLFEQGIEDVWHEDTNLIFRNDVNQMKAYGLNQYGQLGSGNTNDIGSINTLMTYPYLEYVFEILPWESYIDIKEISAITMSRTHTLIKTKDNKYYGIGSNMSFELNQDLKDLFLFPIEITIE